MTTEDPLLQIRALGDLLERGLITRDEYDEKKRDLLALVGKLNSVTPPPIAGSAPSPPQPPRPEQPCREQPPSGLVIRLPEIPLEAPRPASPAPPPTTEQNAAADTDILPPWYQPDAEDDPDYWREKARTQLQNLKQLRQQYQIVHRRSRGRRLQVWYFQRLLDMRSSLPKVMLAAGPFLCTAVLLGAGIVAAFALTANWWLVGLVGLVAGLTGFGLGLHALLVPTDAELREEMEMLAVKLHQRERFAQRIEMASETYEQTKRTLAAMTGGRNVSKSPAQQQREAEQFDQFVEGVLKNLGYTVEVPATRVDGADFVAIQSGERIAVATCGYASSLIGRDVIHRAHAAIAPLSCRRCAVITDGNFSSSARILAEKASCILIDGSRFRDLARGRITLG